VNVHAFNDVSVITVKAFVFGKMTNAKMQKRMLID